jgi:heptaprenyl diphosphate synthase
LLSLSGGFASLAVITLIASVCPNVSYFVLSIAGALTHNMAQLSAASWLVSTNLLMVYLPVLAGAGIAAGSLTAVLLRVVTPLFKSVPENGAEVSQT